MSEDFQISKFNAAKNTINNLSNYNMSIISIKEEFNKAIISVSSLDRKYVISIYDVAINHSQELFLNAFNFKRKTPNLNKEQKDFLKKTSDSFRTLRNFYYDEKIRMQNQE